MIGKKTIEYDMAAGMLSQGAVDWIYSKVIAAREASGADVDTLVDITIKSVPTRGFPRLIVDHGELFETLCEVAKEYRDYRRSMEMHIQEMDLGDGATFQIVRPGPASEKDLHIVYSSWTCTNHAEPIHYTDGTEECYCGQRKAKK